MNVAISALGESPDAPVDQRFGRARHFVLFEVETGHWSAHDNKQNLQAAQGAGIQAAQRVVELGAGAVITGHCGPKAFATLAAAEVDVYQEASGSVRDAFDAYKAGTLQKSDRAGVESGFGSI